MVQPKENDVAFEHVAFDQAFSSRPTVLVNPATAATKIVSVNAANVSASGFDVALYRESSTETRVDWAAIGV